MTSFAGQRFLGFFVAITMASPGTVVAAGPPPEEDEEILVIEEDEDPPAAETSLAKQVADNMAAITEAGFSDPQTAIENLRALLAQVEAHPFEIADDPSAHRARVRALLTLAQLLVDQNDHDGAIANIDEAIRVVRGDPLPSGIEPALEQLIFERLAAPQNAHRGSLHVRCRVPCRVVLDERDVGRGSEISARGIPLGRHRLRIQALNDPSHGASETVLLTAEEPRHEERFEGPPRPTEAASEKPTGNKSPFRHQHRGVDPDVWKMPRWTSIAGLAVGSALLFTGALLIAFDGRCMDLTDPKLPPPCPDVLDTKWLGTGLAVGGGAMMIAFSVTLGIGDARQRKAASRGVGRLRAPLRPGMPPWGFSADGSRMPPSPAF